MSRQQDKCQDLTYCIKFRYRLMQLPFYVKNLMNCERSNSDGKAEIRTTQGLLSIVREVRPSLGRLRSSYPVLNAPGLCFVVLLMVGFPSTVTGQAIPRIDPSGRSGEPPPLLKEEPQPSPKPDLILPPVPSGRPQEQERFPLTRVFVRKIQIIGSTVFSPDDLNAITAPYENRELSYEDLEALRVALTVNYVNRGYINSGAIIPDQTVDDGQVTIRIVEGDLTEINLEGNRWFRDSYIRDRLSLGVGHPFNINTVQERMQLLLQDPRFARLNADLRPGLRLGESVLNVQVEENRPYSVRLEYNNFQSPVVGSNLGFVSFEHNNVFGFGDVLTAQYGGSAGIYPQIDARYTFPFTVRDTALSFHYRKNNNIVVEAPFDPLDIKDKSNIYGITLRQPVYRTLTQQFALELTGERLSDETFLLGEPFSFSPGVHNGKSVVAALRFAQEWIGRSDTQVLAARSRFSFGIDALGATSNPPPLPNSHFFAWLGQFQWARRWSFLGIETLWRNDAQLAANSLFPLEQIAVGGRYSVRGYRETTFLRDSAVLGSFEARLPLVTDKPWADYLQFASFYDAGYSWNKSLPTLGLRALYSVGVGLRWATTLRSPVPIRPYFEFYWGYPLKKVKTQGGNLQDHGINLMFAVTLF